MRLNTCLLASGVLLMVGSSCQRDQIAPDCFFTDSQGNCILRETPGPDTNSALDCGAPPAGAVAAQYSYVVDFEGEGLVFSAQGLPAGLNISATTGEINGQPAEEGTFADAVITMTDDAGRTLMSECEDIEIGPELDHGLYDLPDLAPLGCVPVGGDINDHITGGNGTDITCTLPSAGASDTCPLGDGNGVIPDGVSFDAATCMASGSPNEGHHGTWIWMVAVEQAGNTIHVPFCATEEINTFHGIDVTMDGGAHDNRAPAIEAFDPAAAFDFGSDSDPRFEITEACAGGTCNNWGYKFVVTCSPFDPPFSFNSDGSLDDGMGANIGFFHHMQASTQGATVEEQGLGDRAWVLNWKMWYCTSDNGADCDGDSDTAIYDNAQSTYTMSVIAHPQ